MTYSSGSRREPPLAAAQDHRTYTFLDFELDVPRAELRRAGAPVSLSAQSFATLLYLVRQRERIVTREELVAVIWAGVVVGEGSLRQVVWEIRQALGDAGSEQRTIKTVRGRGYRFVAQVAEKSVATASHAERATSATLFGRGGELARLEAALDASLNGAGRACLVTGAPGIGKSRLVHELLSAAPARGLALCEAHADQDGVAPPLWPWLVLLTGALADAAPAQREAYQRLAPAVFKLLEEPSAGAASIEGLERSDNTPAQQRLRLIDELSRLFGALLSERPRLLVLEDAQWADETSLAFLGHFASVLPRTRALLLVTSRSVPRKQNRALARAVEELMRGALNERVELGSLSLDEIRCMLEAHAGSVTPALAAEVHTLSQGNPLFALELSRLLAHCDPEQRAEHLHQQIEVHTVIRRRLETLPEPSLEAVFAASVLGNEFTLAEVAGVLQEPPDAAVARLDVCLTGGVLAELTGAGRYRFAHPLVRDAAYACLGASARVQLHLRAGDWLERRAASAGASCLNELAHHFFLAAAGGAAAKAVHYASRCAEHAYDATAYANAVAHYDRALQCSELIAEFDARQRLELELARGEARRASGEPAERVNQLFLEIARRADALGHAELFARAALGYAGQRSARFTPTRFVATVSNQEIALLERALRGLGDRHDELRVLLLCALVFALIYSLERERRERLAHEALEIARRLGDPALIARVLLLQIYACAAPDSSQRRLNACHDVVDIARANALKEEQVLGHVSRALCLLSLGDAHGARQDELSAMLLAEELGSPRVSARSRLLALLRAFSEGDLALAEQLSQQALEVAKDDVSEQMLHLVRMSAVRTLRSGDLLEVIAVNEGILANYPDALPSRCALAAAYAVLGQTEAALRQFDWVARDDFGHVPEDILWLSEMFSLADTASALNDPVRARLVYDELAPYGDLFGLYAGGAIPAGPVAYWLGILCTTLGEYERAEAWHARAQALNKQLGAHMFTHCVAVAQARLIFRARPREAARARVLLDEARAFAEQKGIRWMIGYVDLVSREARRDDTPRAERPRARALS